jgi:hypothetical protein
MTQERIKQLEQAIIDADEALEAMEGIGLLYSLGQFTEQYRASKAIIEEIVSKREPRQPLSDKMEAAYRMAMDELSERVAARLEKK